MTSYSIDIEPLWSQGGGEQIFGAIIFLLLVLAQALKAYFDARSARAEEEKQQKKSLHDPVFDVELNESPSFRTKPHRERKRTTRKQTLANETENTRKTRGTLSRELAPQGEGTRFETVTGTLNQYQYPSQMIEPTVKPMLESMTGIYEAAPVSSELRAQHLTFDVQTLIASPEGLRQAVLLSEILKRPEF
ncbi:MAG: hypothetical protein LBQ50_11490 [Planctomycetaceae bacterium]|jgi:hypothetical protein|nr:hypothetical protein [Planctomycetaceae bacterium]